MRMEEVKRIYILLLHNSGLKIKDISTELDLDKYYVADILFSTDNIPFWYQDSSLDFGDASPCSHVRLLI